MLCHVTVASEGRQVLFRGEDATRKAVRALHRVAGAHTLLFNIADDHVHLVLDAPEDALPQLRRVLLLVLGPLAAPPLDPARVRPVQDRKHLERLVPYVLGQGPHHDLGGHPALWTGSCFLDFVGARVLPGYRFNLGEALPRFRMRTAYAAVGLRRDGPLAPADDAMVRSSGPGRLAAAAAAALAVPGSLAGREAAVLDARTAAVQVGHGVGIPLREISFAVQAPLRNVQRLVHRPLAPEVHRAVRLRLALEEAVREAAVPVTGEPQPSYLPGEPGEAAPGAW